MSKTQYRETRVVTLSFLISNRILDHMFHGPVSNRYWNEPFRVIAVNMESYGYQGHNEVDRAMLIDWLYDNGNTRTRTARYTYTLMSVLLACVLNDEQPNAEKFRSAYSSCSILEQTLDRTVYYNIRPESNTVKAQDFGAIASTGASEIGALIWSEIRALDPKVILVSGHAGLDALNNLAKLDPPLKWKGATIHPDGFWIQSVAHPSRPNYAAWSRFIDDIGAWAREGCFIHT
jgi:hypothetical protein